MAPRTAHQRQLLDTHRKEITAGTGADAEVHANDKKLFEALKAKQDKVEALKFEISRIRVKEWEDGLTAGMLTLHRCCSCCWCQDCRCVLSGALTVEGRWLTGDTSALSHGETGQQKQVENNEAKIQRLMDEIEDLEDQMRDRWGWT